MKRSVLAYSRASGFDDVAVSGPFVAWEERTSRRTTVSIFDRRTRRVVEQIGLPPGSDLELSIDAYGAVAIGIGHAGGPIRCPENPARVAVLRPGTARPLEIDAAASPAVRIAAGTVAYSRRRGCEPSSTELVIADQSGRTQSVVTPPHGPGVEPAGFDYDGSRITYAAVERLRDSQSTVILLRRAR